MEGFFQPQLIVYLYFRFFLCHEVLPCEIVRCTQDVNHSGGVLSDSGWPGGVRCGMKVKRQLELATKRHQCRGAFYGLKDCTAV